jgi:hypothetical protein
MPGGIVQSATEGISMFLLDVSRPATKDKRGLERLTMCNVNI